MSATPKYRKDNLILVNNLYTKLLNLHLFCTIYIFHNLIYLKQKTNKNVVAFHLKTNSKYLIAKNSLKNVYVKFIFVIFCIYYQFK